MNGLSNKEIARALNIAHGTVKVHLYDIFQRLEVTSRTKLVHKLITRGQ
jgi:DNA-binding NarL/FixJ family response regulator